MSALDDLAMIAPDVFGEAIGWRAWTVIKPTTRHPRLRSANAAGTVGLEHAMWPPDRWMFAVCPMGHDASEVPVEGCSCGLYSAKELDHLLDYGYAQFAQDGVNVVGEVGNAGRVIEGTQGWKAQRSRVRKLYVPLAQDELGEHLSAIYRVPYELGPWWATDPRLYGR